MDCTAGFSLLFEIAGVVFRSLLRTGRERRCATGLATLLTGSAHLVISFICLLFLYVFIGRGRSIFIAPLGLLQFLGPLALGNLSQPPEVEF
jgi:hypothetical protein